LHHRRLIQPWFVKKTCDCVTRIHALRRSNCLDARSDSPSEAVMHSPAQRRLSGGIGRIYRLMLFA